MASAGTQSINSTNHEDYTDILTIVEPTKTPCYSSIRKGRNVSAVYHEFTLDNLKDVSSDTVPEGHDITEYDNAGENRQRVGNYVQTMETTWKVTDLEIKSNPAGVDDMAAESKAKKMAEWKRNWASRICGDYEMENGPNYKARGLGNWISYTAQATNPVPAIYRTPTAAVNTTVTGSLTEADINNVLAAIWTESGDLAVGTLYANTNLKKAISGFARQTTSNLNYHVNEDSSSNKVTRNVTLYEGDFGTVKVVPDQFIGAGGTANAQLARGYFLNHELTEINWMIPLHHEPGIDAGGGPRGGWKGTGTLSVLNPLAFGKWAATS